MSTAFQTAPAAPEAGTRPGAPAVPPTGVLVLTNDAATPFTKTSEAIGRALRRRGVHCAVRDTALLRRVHTLLEEKQAQTLRGAWEQFTGAKFRLFCDVGYSDTVLGLDLSWLVAPEVFLSLASVRQVFSLWFDDLRTSCATLPGLATRERSFQETLAHPKLTHCFFGSAQRREAEVLGLRNSRLSPLAAPAEMLAAEAAPEVRGRLAFIGGPGGAALPSPAALAAMDRREPLVALRWIAAREVLLEASVLRWARTEPQVFPWIAESVEAKVTRPQAPAVDLLLEAGRRHPRALAFIDEQSAILDAALHVKQVLRYDRAGTVRRLHDAGLCDVLGAPWYWEHYGVRAGPQVPFPRLAAAYQRWPAHVNAAYSVREAPANEKLYEIAACARPSFNLRSPDVAAAYAEGEVFFVDSLDELEIRVAERLARPGELAAAGARARARTAAAHTWEHRLAGLGLVPLDTAP